MAASSPASGPVTILADAPGVVSQIPGGVRITFGKDRADLNPDTERAVRNAAQTAAPGSVFTVIGTAAGPIEDQSTARRLSLQRVLNARAVLIAAGIASSQIYPKALGAGAIGDGPADRVDLTIAAPAPTPAPSAAKPQP